MGVSNNINPVFNLSTNLSIVFINFQTLLFFLSPLRVTMQGRRRFLKSGTAIERHRRSARAEGSSVGEHKRGGGVRGISPGNFFEFNMSVEAILMRFYLYFETFFACKIRLIVQAFHVAVFKCVSKSNRKAMNMNWINQKANPQD